MQKFIVNLDIVPLSLMRLLKVYASYLWVEALWTNILCIIKNERDSRILDNEKKWQMKDDFSCYCVC
jgi:hypothetical protein